MNINNTGNGVKTAMDYLSQDPLLQMGMIVPIKRGTAEILYASSDGVCLKETASGAYMMSVSSYELGLKLLEALPDEGLFTFHQSFMLNDFKAKVRYTNLLENYQAVYRHSAYLSVLDNIEIRTLDKSHLQIIFDNYDYDVGKEYLCSRLDAGEMFGGYVGDDLVGFVGIHAEGSIGLLKVFDKYKRNGYGASLSSYAVNYQLTRQIMPFIQMSVDNKASLGLAGKLGFDISTEKVYWLF